MCRKSSLANSVCEIPDNVQQAEKYTKHQRVVYLRKAVLTQTNKVKYNTT
jgi:hypothetical protein